MEFGEYKNWRTVLFFDKFENLKMEEILGTVPYNVQYSAKLLIFKFFIVYCNNLLNLLYKFVEFIK